MNPPLLSSLRFNCQTERRRQKVQNTRHLTGLDYLEVSTNQKTLTVYFLGKAPEAIAKANVHIDGGSRIQNIRVLDVVILREDDPELDDSMQVIVDRPGDFSEYQLSLVAADASGQPIDQPLSGVDPRYARLSFSFKVGCPTDLDCRQPVSCPQPERTQPEISYLAKDYASFRQLILDRLSLIMPDWQERHIPDLGIAIAELLAYVGDSLSYYQDAVATEAYLGTARQRISVRRHARLIDYLMHEGCNARAWVSVGTSSDIDIAPQDAYFITGCNDVLPVSGHALLEADLAKISADQYEVFEPISAAPIYLYQAHSKIHFYTWGDRDCCLPKGATTATLVDEWSPVSPQPALPEPDGCDQEPPPEPPPPQRKLRLHPGDMLILEEVMGAKTGNLADADPTHRHVVRLTKVELGIDALYNQPIVEIEWSGEEALPFALCISGVGQAPECKFLQHISVARGNVILVDHGQTIAREWLGIVSQQPTLGSCEAADQPADPVILAERFTAKLQKTSLTFRQAWLKEGAAAHWLSQDPHQALPQITLTGIPAAVTHPIDWNHAEWRWLPQPDLLASRPSDRHFVVEIDNNQRAHLRFGDGELGERPVAGTEFWATYRIGNGTAGNVGAETISHIVFRQTQLSGVTLTPRNPLPAQGGTNPEPIEEVKRFAPQAFRRTLQRAITPDDYARLAEQYTDAQGQRVQRAAAVLRWTGSSDEVVVAIDPIGQDVANPDFLSAITRYLHRYRRIGHRLRVVAAHYVPLDIGLTVCVLPHYLRGHVKAGLLERFSDRRLTDGTLGYFHPDNLSFGDPITVSKLITTALSVQGVESVVVNKLIRLNQSPNQELETGILPLSSFEIALLDNDPSFPEHGKLTLDLRGGR